MREVRQDVHVANEPKEYTLSTDEEAKAKKHMRRVQLRCPHCGKTTIYERADG